MGHEELPPNKFKEISGFPYMLDPSLMAYELETDRLIFGGLNYKFNIKANMYMEGEYKRTH